MERIKQYQQQVEAEIQKLHFGANPRELYEPIRYILSLGGKRMRPVLVFLGSELFGKITDDVLHAALAVEIFHNFTLVHDDLMDNAPVRRNRQTVHEKWGSNIAILSGDAMMIASYQELCKTNSKIVAQLLSLFSETAIKVCEGQQLDMNYEKVQKVSILHYLKMIELKTAVLLGASLKMGAIIANAQEKEAQQLYEFGKHIGIAFQLQDDILDVYADEEKFGKQKGGDIIANKKTYLLLKAMEMLEGNRYMKEELQLWLNVPQFEAAEKVAAVTNIFNFLNVKELAEQEMIKQYEKALTYLKNISVSDEKKKTLTEFTSRLMKREV